MGWIQQLVKTYDACLGGEQFKMNPLQPISHTPQQIHIEIVLDEKGNFRRALLVQKEEVAIPATEKSANRTNTNAPHPLCDKIQYVAVDYQAKGGVKPPFHVKFLELLGMWCKSPHTHPKAQAVLNYVTRGTVVADLVSEKLLHLDADGKLLTKWVDATTKPAIFRLLSGADGEQDQGNAFIRWRVEIPGDMESRVWLDRGLQKAWIEFNATLEQSTGLCMATGELNVPLTASHPKRLRHAGDGAKLISSNDASGFTFRGRFTDKTGEQACGVGYNTSQKAHLALRWLIARQAFRNGDQVVVSWAVNGEEIPDPLENTFDLLGSNTDLVPMISSTEKATYKGDAEHRYALELKKKIAGYRTKILPTDNIIIMALDAATPGRMAITFYREFGSNEFFERLENWHARFAWHQNFGKKQHFTGAPAPRDIAEAAYGMRLDERLRKACIERLLPCIADGQPIPRDLVEAIYRRVIRRVGLDEWEWEKALGIACALFRGYKYQLKQEEYTMTLEANRTSRDYLFGRLLAIAEQIEERALFYGGEKRDTHAAKLMQRFADHPCATWRQIELALTSSKSRLRSRSPGFLHQLEREIDQIIGLFQKDDFIEDRKLSGEFLLGYHSQRATLYEQKAKDSQPESVSESEINH